MEASAKATGISALQLCIMASVSAGSSEETVLSYMLLFVLVCILHEMNK